MSVNTGSSPVMTIQLVNTWGRCIISTSQTGSGWDGQGLVSDPGHAIDIEIDPCKSDYAG